MTSRQAAEILGVSPRQAENILRAAGVAGRPVRPETPRPGRAALDFADADVIRVAEERRAKMLARREPTAVESPEVAELWRRCEAADREVTALRQLLAQGRPVTDADLARVQSLIRGEASGAWLGRPPTWEEAKEHMQEHGAEDAAFVLVYEDGAAYVEMGSPEWWSYRGSAIVDAAMPPDEGAALALARKRAEQEKEKREERP